MSSYPGTFKPLARMHKAQCQQHKPRQNGPVGSGRGGNRNKFYKAAGNNGTACVQTPLSYDGLLSYCG